MWYELHITAPAEELLSFNNQVDKGFSEGVPLLAVGNLNEKGEQFRTDWMTCVRVALASHHSALQSLGALSANLGLYEFRSTRIKPLRRKIEAECLDDFDPLDFLYIETHFPVSKEEASIRKYGISRNIMTGKLIATERCYDQSEFRSFAESCWKRSRKVELCLFDSNQSLDFENNWLGEGGSKRLETMSPKTLKAISEGTLK